MPRQRIHHSRVTYQVPHDFPERLVRFKEESDLPWAEIHRRLDVHPETARRRREKDVLPSTRNYAAQAGLLSPERRSRRAWFSRSSSSEFLILSTSVLCVRPAIPLVLGGPSA